MTALASHRQRQAVEIMAKGPRYERNDFVFTNESGRFLDPSYVSKRFTKLLAAAGLPKLRLYAARHTAITHQLVHGVDAMTVAKRAGHSSTTLTTDTYGHLIDSADRRAAEVIDTMLLQRAAAL